MDIKEIKKIIQDLYKPSKKCLKNNVSKYNIIIDGEFIREEYRDCNYKLHSIKDKPAIIKENGEQMWYNHGLLHRKDDKPAIVKKGEQIWYTNGILTRGNDKPARIITSKNYDNNIYYYEQYYTNGVLTRENDKPAIEYYEIDNNNNKIILQQEWWYQGVRHREDDKPAIISNINQRKEWWNCGKKIK